MPLVQFTEMEFLQIGLENIGFAIHRQNVVLNTKLKRFQSSYGAHPKACAAMYTDLQAQDIIVSPDIDDFLMTLKWLYTYCHEGESAGSFNLDEKTVRKRCWTYAIALQSLKAIKV